MILGRAGMFGRHVGANLFSGALACGLHELLCIVHIRMIVCA